jgi:hypothetical protein
MQGIVRKSAIALVVLGLFSTIHRSQSQSNSRMLESTSSARVPVPVCPPNDPNACHIDQWGK